MYQRPVLLCLLLTVFFSFGNEAYGQFVNGNFSQPGVLGSNVCHGGTGWTYSGGNASPQYTNVLGPSTNYWVDLTPCLTKGNGTFIEQKVPTVAGSCYRIQLDLGTYCRWDMSDAGVYIDIDGKRLWPRIFNDSFDCSSINVMYWETFSTPTFTATGSFTTIRFTGEGRCTKNSPTSGIYSCTPPGSIGNPEVIGIDNIILIKEPFNPPNPTYANIDTLYLCDTTNSVTVKAINAAPTAQITWSVLNGKAIITGSGSTVNVTPKETSQILMKVVDTATCSGVQLDTVTLIVSSIKASIHVTDDRNCAKDTIYFKGSYTTTVNATPIITQWFFDDGTTGSGLNESHSYPQGGTHMVMFVATDSIPCSDTAYAEVKDKESYPPPHIDLGPTDTSLCTGVTLDLPLGISVNGSSYLWSDGSTNPRYHVTKAGKYIVMLANNCGDTTLDSITVDYRNCNIWFPSAFTPNGDGKNDIARLLGASLFDITDYELYINNRYGNNVFKTNSVYNGWDGRYHNIPQPIGTYYYFIRYTILGEEHLIKGDITLLR